MSSSIRSKIATFEAHNESERRSSSGMSSRSNGTSSSPPRRKRTTGNSIMDSPAGRSTSTIDGGGRTSSEQQRPDQSVQQPQLNSTSKREGQPAAKASSSVSTAAASQNRISRLRQQQQQVKQQQQQQKVKQQQSSAHANATNLLEKRKQMKERRMMQQQKQQRVSTTSPSMTPEKTASPSPSSLKTKVELARRTKYQTQPSPEPEHVNANHAGNSSSQRISTPGNDSSKQNAPTTRYDGEGSVTSSRSNNNHTRMSPMMQRMQKMKGKDHVKRSKDHRPRTSVANSSVTVASAATSKSTATTAIADRNLSSNSNNYSLSKKLTQQQAETPPDQRSRYSHHHERRRKELQEKRRSEGSQPRYRTTNTSMDREATRSPVALHRPIEPEDSPFSPGLVQHDNSFSHLAASSPRSATDGFSEGNYDASLDHGTDDEATLTSVRRVMAKDSPSSPLRPRYHHLTSAQSPRDTEISGEDPMISAGNRHHHHQSHHTSLKSSRSGEDYNSPVSFSGTKPGGGNMTNGTSVFEREGNTRKMPIYSDDRRRREWINEEKSDKGGPLGGGGMFQTASSSDYDTDGDISKTSKTSRQSNILEGPSNSQATDATDFFTRSKYAKSRKVDDDDKTFDYGDRDDDDSAGSYAVRRRREKERRTREAIAAREAQKPVTEAEAPKEVGSPLINKDDVEHYAGSFEDPMTKLGAGVVGAATVGCLVLGPLGLLVGAAAVGVGVGVMQIPEEKREKLQSKAQKAFTEIHDKAMEASETLSSSCGAAYNDSGMAEHLPVPPCIPAPDAAVDNEVGSARSDRIRGTASDGGPTKGVAKPVTQTGSSQEIGMPSSPTPSTDRMTRNKKVACLRNVGILPASQIHGLDPAAQPRAWLDVVASANTTGEEKIEAIEEILILAKDKRRARIFLDEGILDWIVWTLSRYFEKINCTFDDVDWANPEVTPTEKTAVKLAAMCCVTLGKAHCAAIHTEGDLLLMSLYERGTVPEVRQVAQMLHEVPHHVRITKTPDPTIIDPSKEVFSLRQLTLPQAEDLARSVMEVANGRL